MEYGGAADTSFRDIEHEISHSYFGRGVRSSDSSTSWIDEAVAVWFEEYLKDNENIFINDKNKILRGLGMPRFLAATNLGVISGNKIKRNSDNYAYYYGANFLSFIDFIIKNNTEKKYGFIDVLKKIFALKNNAYITNNDIPLVIKRDFGVDVQDEFDFFINGKPLYLLNYKKIYFRYNLFINYVMSLINQQNERTTTRQSFVNGKYSLLQLAATGQDLDSFLYFEKYYGQEEVLVYQNDPDDVSLLTYALTGNNPMIINYLLKKGFNWGDHGPSYFRKMFYEKSSAENIDKWSCLLLEENLVSFFKKAKFINDDRKERIKKNFCL